MELRTSPSVQTRKVIYRTRGDRHGPITRLMSPSDLGEGLKPFVFLDLFEFDARSASSMTLHPHSGIATVTVLAEGEFRFNDVKSGSGTIGYGGVEWMRAGGGVWHGKEMTHGDVAVNKGFQLWLALPSELENGLVDSQYIEASEIPTVGSARVILGDVDGVVSPVRSPAGLNYLLVTLLKDETWTYVPPEGHSQLWLAVANGLLHANGDIANQGEMVVLGEGEGNVVLVAGPSGAVFVLGSAIPHPHDLVLGYYSVHTTPEALAQGEGRIKDLKRQMDQAGIGSRDGPVAVYGG